MTILFPFAGSTIGGSHIATISLIKKLNEKGISTKIVLHEEGLLAKFLEEEGLRFEFIDCIPVTSGPFLQQISKVVKAARILSKWLKEKNIETVHTNDLRMHYTWMLACNLASINHIWHQHSYAPSWRLWLYMALPRHILTISDYTASSLPLIYKTKIEVIYNDFDVPPVYEKQACRISICEEIGIERSKRIFGFVGNLTNQKRPAFFLDIAKRYLEIPDAPDAHFTLIGAPRDETRLVLEEKLKEYPQIRDNISFIGPRFPVDAYIAGFDALVAPATQEGLGRTLVESMLLKTPVFAACHGGHKEIIQNKKTGFLFDPANAEQCAHALEDNLQSAEISTITQTAYEYALRKFTGPAYLQKIIKSYNIN